MKSKLVVPVLVLFCTLTFPAHGQFANNPSVNFYKNQIVQLHKAVANFLTRSETGTGSLLQLNQEELELSKALHACEEHSLDLDLQIMKNTGGAGEPELGYVALACNQLDFSIKAAGYYSRLNDPKFLKLAKTGNLLAGQIDSSF